MLLNAGCDIVLQQAAYFHHVKYAPNACIAGALRGAVTFAEFEVKCTGWANWILHSKVKYYVLCLIDPLLLLQ